MGSQEGHVYAVSPSVTGDVAKGVGGVEHLNHILSANHYGCVIGIAQHDCSSADVPA